MEGYPLVNIQKAIENDPRNSGFTMIYPLKMGGSFHSEMFKVYQAGYSGQNDLNQGESHPTSLGPYDVGC
jgi:hypothetical protein